MLSLQLLPESGHAAAKAENAKRPEMAAEMSDEDLLKQEGNSTHRDDIVLQLMECCCRSRDHHRTFPKGDEGTATESNWLEQLKLAVQKKNRADNRVKLSTMKQDTGEPVRKFAGRVRSLATVSEYAVKCQYTEAVIMDQVITGLVDIEIQKYVLSHPDAATLDLQETQVNEVGKPLKCKFCGSSHNKDSSAKQQGRNLRNSASSTTLLLSADPRAIRTIQVMAR